MIFLCSKKQFSSSCNYEYFLFSPLFIKSLSLSLSPFASKICPTFLAFPINPTSLRNASLLFPFSSFNQIPTFIFKYFQIKLIKNGLSRCFAFLIKNVLPQVMKIGANEQKGEFARLSSFIGAIAVADLVKTTLGPRGMDKILVPLAAGPKNKHISVTNDGATILRSMHVDNPAAKILIDISKTQDEEVGDGTTTVAVLAGELLREGEKLIHMRLHPQTIIQGWRMACEAARKKLLSIARDNSTDNAKFEADLLNIARTTISSKLLTQDKQHFAELAVAAVLRLKGSTNLSYIQVIKKLGGSIKESFLCDGLILEKDISIGCKKSLTNCKILATNTPMDYDKIKIYGTRVRVESLEKVQEVSEAEKQKMKDKVDRILAYKPNVYINRQLIYDYPEQLLVQAGVLVIEHADFEGIERISAALGAEIVSTFDSPERSEEVLGTCASIEEIFIGEDKVIRFSGCKRNEACTIVLRGSSRHILDEAERSLHDALCVLVQTVKNKQVIYGGGNAELQMAGACDELAKTVKGKEALAIQGYARALRQIPIIIAQNAGFDANELIHDLEFELKERKDVGINVDTGLVDSMEKLAITECLRSKEMALISASEAAEMIMRVDDIVTCAPRQREKPRMH